MKQYDRMISGLLYSWKIKDEYREELSKKRGEFLDKFNSTSYNDFKTREELIRGWFKYVGKNPCINKPFHCDYGCHISVVIIFLQILIVRCLMWHQLRLVIMYF